DYWLRAACAGARIVHVEDLLAAARLHDAAKTSTGALAMYRESIAVCRQHLGRASFGQHLGCWQQWCHNTGSWLGYWPRLLRWLAWAESCRPASRAARAAGVGVPALAGLLKTG